MRSLDNQLNEFQLICDSRRIIMFAVFATSTANHLLASKATVVLTTTKQQNYCQRWSVTRLSSRQPSCMYMYYNYNNQLPATVYLFTAQSFFACFRGSQEDYHEEDLSKLAAITRREHMKSNELMGTLR